MSFLFKGSNFTNRADRIGQFQSTVCEFGTPLPMAYGTCMIAPNLINYQDFTTKEKKTTHKSGKSKSTQIDYLYYAYVELALCEGIISNVRRIWAGNTEYSSLAAFNGANDREGAPLSLNVGNNANPTTYMTTKHPDIAVGYSNMAYLYGFVFLGMNNASIPSYKVEVDGALRATGDGTDANPADVIEDLLSKVGLDQYIDDDSFDDYRLYCTETDLLISTPADAFTSQRKVQEVIKEILTLTNAYMFWSVDRFKIVPRDSMARGTWTPPATVSYHLTKDDFLPQNNGAMVSFSIKDSSEQYNRFGVTFTNRGNEYEQETVFFDNPAEIEENGLKAAPTLTATWFHTQARAVKVAEMQARINRTENVKYTFKLDWAFSRLEPGDLVTLTDENIGLNQQLCMVESVTEDTKGTLTVTAIKRAGTITEADYDIHTVDYNHIDWNINPGNTAAPLFIIPPADLVTSANGLEIWVALHGVTDKWGGCNVYMSDKDGDYSLSGTQGVSSIYGKTQAALAANGTSVSVHFTNPKTVEILTGSQQDAQNGNTLIWLDGECMSYTLATLTAPNTYTLSGLVRGQYGTQATAHTANSDIAVLDGSIFVVPLTKHYQGRTMFFKFPAFNEIKTNNQDIADLDYYTCQALAADLPNCQNVTAYNKYRELADDVVRYDIAVEWTPPAFNSYRQAQVWYKTTGTQAKDIGVIPAGVTAAQLGYSGKWLFAGQGYDSVIIPQAVIGDTYKIAVCTEDIYGNIESPDSSAQVEIFVARKTEIPDTPDKLTVKLTDTFNLQWAEVRNADIKYYEVRTDQNVGVESSSLLARVTEPFFSTNAITARTGTLYVFAVSAYMIASAPAIITYNFPAPVLSTLNVEEKFQGIAMSTNSIPNNVLGVHWYISGGSSNFDVKNPGSNYYYSASAGVYYVNACYYDCLGDGPLYDAIGPGIAVTIKVKVDNDLLEAESVSVSKLSEDAHEAIRNGGINTVNVAVKGILNTGCALVLQPDGSFALVASDGEKLTGLFADESGVIRLQGDYIHITGDTIIDGNVVTEQMIQAGAISADKIQADAIASNMIQASAIVTETIQAGAVTAEKITFGANSWASPQISPSIRRPAVVIESYRSGSSWYRVWSDGFIEQGGKCYDAKSITFVKKFTAANTVFVHGTSDNTEGFYLFGGRGTGGFFAYSITTVGCTIRSGATKNQDYAECYYDQSFYGTWYACGY